MASDAGRYYEDALQRFAVDDYKAAAIQLKNALQQDPNHLPARVLLGRVHLAQGDSPTAEKEIRLAMKLGADANVTAEVLAEALTKQRKFAELIQDVKPQGLAAPIAESVYVSRGNAFLELRDYASAQRAYQQALQLLPDAVAPRIGLVMLRLRQGQMEEAQTALSDLLRAHPDSAAAWHVQGDLAYARGEREEALSHYEKALILSPGHHMAGVSRASVSLDMGRYQVALRELQRLREASPFDPQVSYLLAVALEKTGDADAARDELRHAMAIISAIPEDQLTRHRPTLLLAGLISFSAGELERAHEYLSAYLAYDPGNLVARKLLATALLAMKEPHKAIPVIQAAINLSPDQAELYRLLGEAYLQAQLPNDALYAFGEAERLEPGRIDVLAKVGVARLFADDREAAIRDMEQVFAQRPDAVNIAATLAAAHMSRGDFQRARAIAAQVLDRDATNVVFLNLLGAAQANLGDLAAARTSYEQALALQPGYRPAQINLAYLDAREGHGEAAIQRLETLSAREPENLRLLFELAKLYEGQGRQDHAVKLLEKIHQLNARAVYPALRLIELRIARGQSEAAVKTAQLLKASYPDRLDVLAALGRAYAAAGVPAQAQGEFRRMSRLAGYDGEKLQQIAQWQMRLAAPDDARWTLQKAVEADPDDPRALAALSGLSLRQGQLDTAQELIAQFRERFPDDQRGLLLEGDLAMQRGAAKDAEAAYRQARALGDNDVVAIRVYRAQRALGREPQAVAELRDWVRDHSDAGPARLALAEALHGRGALDEAQHHYEAAIARGLASAEVLNNLANLYLELGDERALQLALRAHAAAPQRPEILDTLGWTLVRTGDPVRGLAYLRDAVARDAASVEIRYHLGVALEALGREREAAQQFERVLRSPGDSPLKQEARKHLGQGAGP